MRLVSWNVNGLRAVMQKGFMQAFASLEADIFCLQETKLQEGQITLELPGYSQYWSYAVRKGYSGTALFAKRQPLAVSYGMGIEEHDTEGRIITAEWEDFYLVNVYVPNSQEGLKRLDYRLRWEDDFRSYLSRLASSKGVIVCGDMNVAHQEIDIKNPNSNHRNAGFTDEERTKMSELLSSGFTDSFRFFYPDKTDVYSWWSYRFHSRERNTGWRIDYFLVSTSLKGQMKAAAIHTNVMGSDHCPVSLEID